MTQEPKFHNVRQRFDDDGVRDVAAAVAEAIQSVEARGPVNLRGRVAITAGSRGIDAIADILAAVVSQVRLRGGDPFIVGAMGSHGGATAEGQQSILAGFGITEESVGCPVSTAMAAVEIGRADSGFRVFADKAAAESDGIIVVGRVKPHSILVGELGSGLLKMLVIGLGKREGADSIHREGLQGNLAPAADLALSKLPVAFGLALVENGLDRLSIVEGVPPREFAAADQRLLEQSRRYLPRLPFDPIDCLIVRQIGKNISGVGMDPNVVGMHRRNGGPPERRIDRIVALDLTPESRGNALGVGMADVITERLHSKMDFEAMKVNALTSNFLWGLKVPLTMPMDRDAVGVGLRGFEATRVRALVIRDTAHLDEMLATAALLEDETDVRLEIDPHPIPLRFAAAGNLL